MIKTLTINKGEKLSKEQLQEVEAALKMPIIFDEDCPELSPDMEKAFRSAIKYRNRNREDT
ncbi:MAG: hypothetical protein ACI4S2_06000 [Lachnospiraceae bacterium]